MFPQLSSVRTTVTSSGARSPRSQYRWTSLYRVHTCGVSSAGRPVTSAMMPRWVVMISRISSMPSPSGRLVSPFPRIPSVTTPSKSSSTMRRIPSRQYARMASALRRYDHSPVPP